MNKLNLTESLLKVLSTKTESKLAVEKIFDLMKSALRSGDKVVIQGFGSFHTVMRKGKLARNPKTGAPVKIPPRRSVKFKTAKDFF